MNVDDIELTLPTTSTRRRSRAWALPQLIDDEAWYDRAVAQKRADNEEIERLRRGR